MKSWNIYFLLVILFSTYHSAPAGRKLAWNSMWSQKTLYLYLKILSFAHESTENCLFCAICHSKTTYQSQAILVSFERASFQLAFLSKTILQCCFRRKLQGFVAWNGQFRTLNGIAFFLKSYFSKSQILGAALLLYYSFISPLSFFFFFGLLESFESLRVQNHSDIVF